MHIYFTILSFIWYSILYSPFSHYFAQSLPRLPHPHFTLISGHCSSISCPASQTETFPEVGKIGQYFKETVYSILNKLASHLRHRISLASQFLIRQSIYYIVVHYIILQKLGDDFINIYTHIIHIYVCAHMYIIYIYIYIYIFFFFLAALGFKLRASCFWAGTLTA
jgi:hypothetical protein